MAFAEKVKGIAFAFLGEYRAPRPVEIVEDRPLPRIAHFGLHPAYGGEA